MRSEIGELVDLARMAKERAYSPYSHFQVGSALRAKSGDVFTGCNIENVSFGLTLCAERSALSAAICAGQKQFTAIAIVADSSVPAVPCGACRQVLAEFAPDLLVVSESQTGRRREWLLSSLLPLPKEGILR